MPTYIKYSSPSVYIHLPLFHIGSLHAVQILPSPGNPNALCGPIHVSLTLTSASQQQQTLQHSGERLQHPDHTPTALDSTGATDSLFIVTINHGAHSK
jgi:hypothetical protein